MAKPDEAVRRVEERVVKHYTDVNKGRLSKRDEKKYRDEVRRAADKQFR